MQGTKKLRDAIKSGDFITIQKTLCEKYAVNFKKIEELNSIIESLLQNLNREALMIVNERFDAILRNNGYLKDVFQLSTSSKANLTPKQKTLLELYFYLILAEGIFSEITQVIAFILVKNHHDIYDIEHRKFVKNYEGLNHLNLHEKMQFVEMHGFKFVSDACDRKLRNSIAHLRFVVNEDGSILEITQKGKTGKVIKDMQKKRDYLGCICAITIRAVHGLLGELLKAKRQKSQSP